MERARRKKSEARYDELNRKWLEFIPSMQLLQLGFKEALKAAQIHDFLESKGKMGSIIKIYEREVRIAIEGGYKQLSENLLDKAIAILNKNNRLHDDENGLLDLEFPND